MHQRVVRNTIFRKAPPSVVSGYDKRSINLNKVVATFEKHIFLSQTDLTRTEVIKACYNNGQKERLCLIIDKCRRQKLCKRAQKISAAAPLRVKIIVISRSIGRSKTFFPEKNTEPNHFLEEKIIINTLRLILTNKISLIFRTLSVNIIKLLLIVYKTFIFAT
jgi:hypothetical protein